MNNHLFIKFFEAPQKECENKNFKLNFYFNTTF